MPSSNPDNRFNFRSFSAKDFYDRKKQVEKSDSVVAKRDLETYLFLLEQSDLAQINEEEKKVVYEHLNGSLYYPDTIIVLKNSIVSELIEDGKPDLAQKIKVLNDIQWLALIYGYFT